MFLAAARFGRAIEDLEAMNPALLEEHLVMDAFMRRQEP